MSGPNNNGNTTPIDPATGVPQRPLRTFADVAWKEPPAASAPDPDELPPIEVDPYTGQPRWRPLRTFRDVKWKK